MNQLLARILFLLFTTLCLLTACDSGPRVIESESESISPNTLPSLNEKTTAPNTQIVSDDHKVVIEEALHTDKYSYLHVSENGEKFWIAISKREIKVGDTYYYKGGLLKKNFYSKEFDRTFETVYLVSNFWSQNGVQGAGPSAETVAGNPGAEVTLSVADIQPAPGAILLSKLFSNKQKYNGQVVKITGKCIKVNPMIMNRNWLHIQDRSGEKYELTVTTTETVPVGAVVSLQGTIALDKDFGAGYRYDIIMEGAVLN